jgi:hypothetical protein
MDYVFGAYRLNTERYELPTPGSESREMPGITSKPR